MIDTVFLVHRRCYDSIGLDPYPWDVISVQRTKELASEVIDTDIYYQINRFAFKEWVIRQHQFDPEITYMAIGEYDEDSNEDLYHIEWRTVWEWKIEVMTLGEMYLSKGMTDT